MNRRRHRRFEAIFRETRHSAVGDKDILSKTIFKESLNKLIPFMVRQAHHERNQSVTVRPVLVEGLIQRNQSVTVRPELVEGLIQRFLKNLVRDFATYLFGFPVVEVELLDTAQQRFEERRADLVARVATAEGAPFLLHIEIQNANESHMPVRMLRYLSDILLAFPGLPARQYLVYIGKEPLSMADGLDLPRFSYRYDIVDMHRVDCHALLQQDSPDAWVLAILCDFKECSPRETVRTILTRLVERLGANPSRLREYVSMLDILAGNRDLNLNIREELEMLTIDVEKLATYQMGMETRSRNGKRRP